MVLAGKTNAVSTSEIIEDLTEANADVETMTGLIEELEAALEGKSVEGGNSAEIEMCTVTARGCSHIAYTTLENGVLTGKLATGSDGVTSSFMFDCCRNSVITCIDMCNPYYSSTNVTELGLFLDDDGDGYERCLVAIVTGETADIHIQTTGGSEPA